MTPTVVKPSVARRVAPLALLVLLALVVSPAGAGGSRRPTAPAAGKLEHRTLRFVDRSRRFRLPNGRRRPRVLVTVVRYPAPDPAAGPGGGARSAQRRPYPLLVFAHGYAVTPGTYARLLDAWAKAGYVVAAPVFPRTSATAPGGPDEADIVNQPRDVSFVISRLLRASAATRGFLTRLIDPRHIAVIGHSDGGSTALATAFDRRYRDPRLDAAVILSGARFGGFEWSRTTRRALLAVQGTADTTNLPRNTWAYFAQAPRPKYLLALERAGHLTPYTRVRRYLHVVEGATIAFLDRYLKGRRSAARRLLASGRVPHVSLLTASP